MANEIDILMDKDPTDLSAQELDAIILYQRRARSNFESGIKPAKERGPKTSLNSVVQALSNVPKAEPIKRRF